MATAEAARWDAQSAHQLDVITKAGDGIAMATAVAQGFQSTWRSRQALGLPHYVWSPLYAVMAGYVDVLIASDLTVPARALLRAPTRGSDPSRST